MAALAGVTLRQLDWWTSVGYVTPSSGGGGHGRARYWGRADAARAIAVARLVRAGLKPAHAAALVETWQDPGAAAQRFDLGDGVALVVEPVA